jgi:hypothetical protein
MIGGLSRQAGSRSSRVDRHLPGPAKVIVTAARARAGVDRGSTVHGRNGEQQLSPFSSQLDPP